MKQRIIKYFSLTIILLLTINLVFISYDRIIKYKTNKKIINNLINKKNGFNYITDNVVGYLEIERLNVKNVIKKGVGDTVLDENVIGMLEHSNFGLNHDDIFLAGHNIKEVFANLHMIKIGDIVKITTNDSCYKYVVNKILIINENEIGYLINNHSNKLTMMTCTNRANKRLIVICRYSN